MFDTVCVRNLLPLLLLLARISETTFPHFYGLLHHPYKCIHSGREISIHAIKYEQHKLYFDYYSYIRLCLIYYS